MDTCQVPKSNTKKEWEPNEIGLLISLIRPKPDLYDKSVAGYNCKDKSKIWEKIATQIGTKRVEQCKAKWQSLRSKYAQYRNGHRHLDQKSWPFFDDLSFLEKHVYDEEATTDVSSEGSDDDSELFCSTTGGSSSMVSVAPRTSELRHSDEETDSESLEEENVNEKINLKLLKQETESESLEEENVNGREASENENNTSSMEYFFLSLLDDINMLPPEKQLCFKAETMQLLLRLWNETNENE